MVFAASSQLLGHGKVLSADVWRVMMIDAVRWQ